MKKCVKIYALILVLSILVAAMCACGTSKSLDRNKVAWDELVLGDMLPAAPTSKGDVWSNSQEELRVDIKDVTAKQFVEYLEACEKEGFTVEAVTKGDSYTAFNDKGYRLELNYSEYLEVLTINLCAPVELDSITWPTSTAGSVLPAPKSTTGKFEFEHDTSFFVYIGETTKEDYNAYVDACSEAGFNLEYNKGDDYYYANNAEGWHISLNYVGNGVMTIKISESSAATTETTTGNQNQTSDSSSNETPSTGIRPEFQEAMDSYEEFMNEYVAFMEKVEQNPNDVTLMMSYAQYLSDYAEFCEDFEAWEDQDMNIEEQKYYIDVQARVNKLLLDAAS